MNSLSMHCLSSSLTWNGQVKNGELLMTSISTLILGYVPLSSLKLNASLYLYNMSSKNFSESVKHVHLAMDVDHLTLVFLSCDWL